MTPVLAAEWTKLRTLPSTLWTLLIACIAALGGSVVLTVASTSAPNAPFDPVTGIFIGWGEYPVLAVGILGALAVTNEYGNRMIRTTFTAVPRRLPVLGAKAAIVGGLVLIVMMALAWAAFAIAEIVRGIHHQTIPLTDPGVARSVAMAGLAMAALAVLGTGIGALVRQTVAAVMPCGDDA